MEWISCGRSRGGEGRYAAFGVGATLQTTAEAHWSHNKSATGERSPFTCVFCSRPTFKGRAVVMSGKPGHLAAPRAHGHRAFPSTICLPRPATCPGRAQPNVQDEPKPDAPTLGMALCKCLGGSVAGSKEKQNRSLRACREKKEKT